MAPRESLPELIWRLLTSNLGTKLVSIVIAVVLWVVVLGSRNVEVTKEVPLEIVTAADIVTANDIPEKISFRLSGPKAFLRAVLDRREEPVRINLTGSKPGLVTYRFFSDSIRVPIGVKVLSINPTAILIKLEHLKRKEIPIKVTTRGHVAEGFKLGKVTVKPDSVRIRGAESRVDSIGEMTTVPIDITGIKQDLEKDISVDLSHYNVQLDGPLPRAHVEVAAVSANYRIKNVDIRVISPYKVRLDEKSVTVLVRAGDEELQTLDRTQVYAYVDLQGHKKGTFREPVRVKLPPDVGLVKVIPDKVNVTLY